MAADSKRRVVSKVDNGEWIVRQDEALPIVPDELWNQVHAIQTAVNPRREAVRKGIAKKAVSGSRYWLGTLLVSAECGSNYIGDGRRDYVCPGHTAGHCKNNLRFRRDDAHAAVFSLLQKELLGPERIARGQERVRCALEEQACEEESAARAAAQGADIRALDEEITRLRSLNLRPAMLARDRRD